MLGITIPAVVAGARGLGDSVIGHSLLYAAFALIVAAAWEAVCVLTLVVLGEFDWITGRADWERIVEIVNTHTLGPVRLFAGSGINHRY